jgi:TP901 family phage tail tape measure protein
MTGSLGRFETATKKAKDVSERNLKNIGDKSSVSFKKVAAAIGVATVATTGLTFAYRKFFGGGKLAGMFGGLGGKISGVTGNVKTMTQEVGGLNNVVGSLITTAVSFSAAQIWGGVFGGMAIGMMHKATRAAEMYQKKLKEVNFVLNSTNKQTRMVDQTITQLGIDTPFSMTQSAEAVYLLASSFGDVNKTLAATPAMMDLTLAGNMGLTEGASLMIQGLNMFNKVNGKTRWELKASARQYADVLTKMQSISPFVMREFNPAFSAASRVISSYNQSLEGTLSVMAMLKQVYPTLPAMAGFGLQLMLPALSNSRKEFERITGKTFLTEKGGPKDLMVLITELSTALGLTAENVDKLAQRADIRAKLQKIFPSEYQMGPFLSIIKGDTRNMKKFYTAIKEESGGFARKFRDDMINTVVGMKRQIRGSIETMWIDIGKTFQPFQQAFLSGMFKAVNIVIGFLQLPLVKYFLAATMAVTAFAGALTMIVPLLLRMTGMFGPFMARGPGVLLTVLGTKIAATSAMLTKMFGMPLKMVGALFGIVGFESRIFAIAGAVFTFAKSFAILYGSVLLVGKLFPELGKALGFAASMIKLAWGGVMDIMSEFFGAFARGWKKAQSDIGGVTGKIFKALGIEIKSADDYLTSFSKTMDAFVNSAFMKTIYGFVEVLGRVVGWFGGIGGRVLGFLVAIKLLTFLLGTGKKLLLSWLTITTQFGGIFKTFAGTAAKGLGFIFTKLTGIKLNFGKVLNVAAANQQVIANTTTTMGMLGTATEKVGLAAKKAGGVIKSFFGIGLGKAGGTIAKGMDIATKTMGGMFAKASRLLDKVGIRIHHQIAAAAKILYDSIVGGFQAGVSMARGGAFTPVIASGPAGMIRGTTMAAGAVGTKKWDQLWGKKSGGATVVSHTGGPATRPATGPVVVGGGRLGVTKRAGMFKRMGRGMGRMGRGGRMAVGGGLATTAMMAAYMVPWESIAGDKAGGMISELLPLSSLAFGWIGLAMAAFSGITKLFKYFGGLISKYKTIALIAGGIAAIIGGIIAAPWTGGFSILAGIKTGVAAIGAGLAVSGATSALLAKKQEQEGIPHLQHGGIIVRGGIARVHEKEVFKPAKAKPLPAGGGLGHGDINISMPISFAGNVIGDLPDEFYEKVQEKITRILSDVLKYEYS